MIKKERMLLVQELELLIVVIENIISNSSIMEEDRKDCKIIEGKIGELIDYIKENSVIENIVLVKVSKLSTITESLKGLIYQT